MEADRKQVIHNGEEEDKEKKDKTDNPKPLYIYEELICKNRTPFFKIFIPINRSLT